MVTLSDSHDTAGAAVAVTREQAGECAGDSHDDGWHAVGRPPWPRALVQTGCALRDGHRLIRIGTTFPVGDSGAYAEALS